MIVVKISSVVDNMFIQIALEITISMITLAGIFFNGRMFHVALVLSLMVLMYCFIFGIVEG